MQYSNPNKISLQRDNPEFFSVLGTPDFYFGLFSILKHKITPKKKNHSEKSAEIRVKLFSQSVEQRTENPCVGGSIPSLPTKNITRVTEHGFFYCSEIILKLIQSIIASAISYLEFLKA